MRKIRPWAVLGACMIAAFFSLAATSLADWAENSEAAREFELFFNDPPPPLEHRTQMRTVIIWRLIALAAGLESLWGEQVMLNQRSQEETYESRAAVLQSEVEIQQEFFVRACRAAWQMGFQAEVILAKCVKPDGSPYKREVVRQKKKRNRSERMDRATTQTRPPSGGSLFQPHLRIEAAFLICA